MILTVTFDSFDAKQKKDLYIYVFMYYESLKNKFPKDPDTHD